MAYRDYSSEISELKKKQKEKSESEKNTKSTKTVDYASDIMKRKSYNSLGLDTLQTDLTTLSKTIDSVYSGWQTQETMRNTLSSVQSMHERLGKYQEYQQKYGGTDLSELQSAYKSVLDGWDGLSTEYAKYKNADAFNASKKIALMDRDYSGLTYDEVQSKKKEYDENSFEYKYFDNYTKYEDLNEFDKAIEARKSNKSKPKTTLGSEEKTFNPDDFKLYETNKDKPTSLLDAVNTPKTKEPFKPHEFTPESKEEYYQGLALKSRDLEAERNKWSLDHQFDLHKYVMQNEDFAENSKYVSTEGVYDNLWDKVSKGQYGLGYGDLVYEYINNVGGVRNKIMSRGESATKDTANLGSLVSEKIWERGYDKLNPDEVLVYNYWHNYDKINGTNKAQEFLADMEINLDKRTYDEQTKRWETANENPILATLNSIASVPASVFGAIPTAVDAGLDAIQGKAYNPYSKAKAFTNFAQDTREYVGDNIAEATKGAEFLGQNVPSFLYQTGMSLADNLMGASTLKNAYLPMMSTNAFHQKAKEMTEAGEDKATIYTTALASAAAEMVFEKISLDRFLKIKGVDSKISIITNTLKQAGVEASEEFFTEIANLISDDAIRGDDSELKKKYQDLLASGYSESEANTEIAKQIGSQIGWAAVGGGLSGGAMGYVGALGSYTENSSKGSEIKSNERISDMLDIANNPEIGEAYEAYNAYAKKGINAENISNAQLGNLYTSAKSGAVETLESKKASADQKRGAVDTLSSLSVIDTENKALKRAKELNVGEETKVTESGENAKIEGIKVTKDGTSVVTDNGEVELDDITLSQNDSELVAYAEQITKEQGEDVGNLFISQYDGEMDMYQYANSFNLTMAYAKDNFPVQTLLERKGSLSTPQVTAIYQATVMKQAKEKDMEIQERTEKQGKTMFIQGVFDDSIIDRNNTTTDGSKVNWSSLSYTQRNAVKFMQLFSKATGVNIKLIKSDVVNGKHKGKNGSYDPDSNTIEIDIYAGRIDAHVINDAIIPTLSHEMTHWMKVKSPSIYNSIKDHIFATLTSNSKKTSEDIINAELARLEKAHPEKNHTVDEAVEEIVARACEDMLSNSNAARKLLNKMSATEQQSFIDKVKETFENLMQWVNDLLARYKSDSAEAKVLREYKDMLKKVSKQWDDMLVQAVERNQALEKSGKSKAENKNEHALRFSEREIIGISGKSYGMGVYLDSNLLTGLTEEERIEMVKEFVVTELAGEHFLAYDTNNDIVDIRIATKGEYFKNEKGKRKQVIRELYSKYNKLKIKQEAVVLIDELIANAKYTSPSKARHKHGWLDNNGNNDWDIWTVYIQEKNKSVWEATLNIANTANGEKILYDIGPIKMVEQAGKSATSTTNPIILNPDPNVKENFADIDTTGRELSEGQKKYFKDSVVRDENGSLKVMYRGDSSEFTVFDRKKTKHSNLYGRGFYFTDSKAHAEQYGGAREFYLDIKNPLSPKQNVITKKQMLNFLKAIENDGEDYDLYNYGQDATAESVLNSVWGKGDFEMLQDINASAIGDLVAAVELFNKVNGTSYDGIILPTETVTFESEQAKLTSNLNPTKNKDIRFSMRENVEETRELVAVHNMQVSELDRTLDLGGLPMPSIAIIKAKDGHSEYGDVSLVFPKSTIDPKASTLNKVYGGDAWTPTYPSIEYKPSAKVSKKINDKYYELSRKFGNDESRPLYNYVYDIEEQLNRHKGEADMLEELYEDERMMQLYLLDSGKDKVETIQKEIRTELSDAEVQMHEFFIRELGANVIDEIVWDGNGTPMSYRKNYLSKYENAIRDAYKKLLTEEYKFTDEETQNVLDSTKPNNLITFMRDAHKYRQNGRVTTKTEADYEATKKAVKDAAGDGYRSWVDSLFKGVEEKSGIRNNTDFFTNSGNRRSWEALHWENNLENVVKVMKSQDNGVAALFSGHAIWAVSAKDYRTVEEIKADADRLKRLSEEEYSAIKQGFGSRFQEIAESIMSKSESNPFIAADNAMSCIVEAVRNSKTKSGLLKNLREYSQLTVTETTVEDIISLVTDISNMPTEYFEAKPRRAVELNEIATAIIPDNTSDSTKKRLDDLGIKYVQYESGNEADRLKALNSLENVKFSDREDVSVYDLMGEADRLSKENENLRADIERLNERLKIEKKVTHGNYFNENQLGAVAGHLRNISKSNMDKVELMKSLKDVYSFIAHSENLTWEDVFSKCYVIADKMIAESKPETVIDDYSKHILDDIRSKRISFSDAQKNEAQYIFGKNWNRNFFGKVTITDSGISLEDQWREWSDLYPSIFDANISDTDMPGALYDILGSLKEASEVVVEYDLAEKTRWLATEIYNQYWNVSPIRTTADKYDKQIKRLNFEHRNAMKELRDNYDTRLKEQHKADREKQKKLVQELRDRKDKQIAEAKQKGRERLDKYKENAERKTYVQRITANALTLNTWIKKNSKDYHIHEAMKGPVIKLLNAIDFSSKSMLEKGEPTQNDVSFAEAFAEVKSMLENADNMVEGLESLYGHDLADQIELLVKASYNLMGDNNYVINAMSIEELHSLDKLVRHIKKVVTDLNRFHIVNHNQGAVNLADEFMEHGEKLGKLEKQHGTMGKFFEFRNRTPYYFFKDLGKVGEKLFEAFQDGWDKLAFNAKKIIDFTKEVYTDKEVQEWSKETKEFKLSQPDGSERTINMSIAQIMSLYCVSKQEDAQTHLLSGGMTLKRIDKKGHVITDYDNINLTYADIKSILDTLTDRQREVADKLQEFMNTVCSDWGNEISMARFGVKMFGLPDYFPIKVSEATVPTDNTKDIDNVSLWRLLNMSFTKARNKNAEQSIEIGDIFDIFAQHSSDMAKYNALALPVLDFNKFYSINYRDMNGKENGVVQTLKSVFGDEANRYLRTFVRDLNGSQNVSRDVIGNTFFKNAKVASVAANLRVVLLQPTAFHKASAVMDMKYLTKASAYIKLEPVGMVKKLKKAIDNAEKYCGIIQWKALGYYDTDISKGLTEKIKHSEGFKDKFIEKSLKGAEIADKVTFGTLWVACEFEIRDTRKDLKVGSEEFYNAIAKRLRDVVYATQVVDSTMTRSDMMRSADGRDKMLTAFGSEPTIAYNMLLDLATQYKRDKQEFGNKEAKKKNSKKIRKVVTAYVITNAVAALVESGFDVFRDDDDEEMDMAEFLKLYFKNFAFDVSIGNKLPYIKELYSTLQGYSSSRMDTQWLQSVNYTIKDIKKIVEGEGDWSKFIKDFAKAMSYMSGLPFYNIFRDAMALLDKLGILDD